MPPRRSAGLLLYRVRRGSSTPESRESLQVLIGHMGGPLWARKDAGAWSVPKGEFGADETPEAAARREFAEELGLPAPDGPWLDLGEVRQSGGKTVRVWAVEADLDPAQVAPGTFTMQWPPRSGRDVEFPELDRVEWCDLETAAPRLVTAQRAFLDRLRDALVAAPRPDAQ